MKSSTLCSEISECSLFCSETGLHGWDKSVFLRMRSFPSVPCGSFCMHVSRMSSEAPETDKCTGSNGGSLSIVVSRLRDKNPAVQRCSFVHVRKALANCHCNEARKICTSAASGSAYCCEIAKLPLYFKNFPMKCTFCVTAVCLSSPGRRTGTRKHICPRRNWRDLVRSNLPRNNFA